MTISRRDMLKLMLASAVAEAADWDRLLWTPKPIITVPNNYLAMQKMVQMSGRAFRGKTRFVDVTAFNGPFPVIKRIRVW